jgi:hypothetical protein
MYDGAKKNSDDRDNHQLTNQSVEKSTPGSENGLQLLFCWPRSLFAITA